MGRESTEFSSAITPEMMLRWYEIDNLNTIPLKDKLESFVKEFGNLIKNREKILKLYDKEFLLDLEEKARNRKGRYKIRNQIQIRVVDLVTIRDNLLKLFYYSRLLVIEKICNANKEVEECSAKIEWRNH